MNINGIDIEFSFSDIDNLEKFDNAKKSLLTADVKADTKIGTLRKQNEAMCNFINDCLGDILFSKLIENRKDFVQVQSVFLALIEEFEKADKETAKQIQEYTEKYKKYMPTAR